VIYFLYTVHILVSIFLILVVLLQQGKGADLSVFGGGTTQTAFGARGATTLLHKLTVASFVIFTLTTLSIGLVKAGPEGRSVMKDVVQESANPLVPESQEGPLTPEAGPAPAAEAPAEGTTPDAPERPETVPGTADAEPPAGQDSQ
jgi:preprotein translocase subunit SecG